MGIAGIREIIKLMRELGVIQIKVDDFEIILGQEPGRDESSLGIPAPESVDEVKFRRESRDGLLDSERVDLYTSSSEE